MLMEDLSILRPEVLTGTIQSFMDDKETRLLPYFSQNAIECPAGSAVWDEEIGGRQLYGHTTVESPAAPVTLMGVKQRIAVPARIFVKKTIPASRVRFTREIGGTKLEQFERIVKKELKDLKNGITRTMEYICSQAFTGTITISQGTDKVQKVIGAVSFSVVTASASANWGTAGTKIITGANELPAVRKAFLEDAGRDVGIGIATDALSRALLGNTEVKGLMSEATKQKLLMDHQLNTFDGVTYGYHDHGYLDGSSAYQKYINQSHVIFLPADYSDVLGMCYAPEIVPTQVDGYEGGIVLGIGSEVNGMFSYSKLDVNPFSVTIFAGINYLPVILKPKAVVYWNWNV